VSTRFLIARVAKLTSSGISAVQHSAKKAILLNLVDILLIKSRREERQKFNPFDDTYAKTLWSNHSKDESEK
jgi:hypothetical protein